jgi:predicted nucleic acid-binding protein
MPLVISDASPLIVLAKIKQLHILKELWSEIIIPEAVYKEVVIEGREKPEVEIIEEGCGKNRGSDTVVKVKPKTLLY